MIKEISTKKFYEMLVHAKLNLIASQEKLNSLNVFPVPDGDTGSNMSLTLKYAVENIKNKNTIKDISSEFAKGALMGARGNSGVIMSQIIKGLSISLDQEEGFTVEDYKKAIHSARERAYKAVMRPQEGTMLSIIRAMDEALDLVNTEDFIECFEVLNKAAEDMLIQTEFMLEANKKAKNVDAGACGVVTIFNAFLDCLKEISPLSEDIPTVEKVENKTESTFNPDDIEFQYCTEFIILKEVDEMDLRAKLSDIGDSIVVVSSDDITKVHVHTNTPGVALNFACDFGDLTKIKIENMKEQAESNLLFQDEMGTVLEEERKYVSIIAVCDGDGLEKCFKDLGVSYIINGGQSMNPSVESIVDAIKAVNSDNVIVLPNNKNIILSAKQAKEISDSNVFVLDSKSVPEGIAAAISFEEGLDLDENIENMIEAINDTLSVHITNAIKDAELDGLSVKENDFISVINDKVTNANAKLFELLDEAVTEETVEDRDLMSIYYGDSMKDKIEEIVDILSSKFEDLDIESIYGGQVTYPLILSIE